MAENPKDELYFPCLYDDVKCTMTWVVGPAMSRDAAKQHLRKNHPTAHSIGDTAPRPVNARGVKCRVVKDDRHLGTDALAGRLNKLLR